MAACVKAQPDCFLRMGDTGGTQPWEMLCTWSTHAVFSLHYFYVNSVLSLFMSVCPGLRSGKYFLSTQFVLHVTSQYLSCPTLPGEMVQPVKARLTSKTSHLTLSELSVAFIENLTHPDHPLLFRSLCFHTDLPKLISFFRQIKSTNSDSH